MKATTRDAVLLLERLSGDCSEGTGEHDWRKCRRCAAIALLQDGDPKVRQLLKLAIDELKRRG